MADVMKKLDIRLSKSCITDTEKNSVMDVLDNEYLGMGAEVEIFENELKEFFGRPVVCVANGTAALQLALQAVGISNDDEVLVQSLTYVASYQAISATGAKPISCDVDSQNLCLDWKDAESKLTSKTKAVMPVHYGGGVGPLGDIYKFAEKNNLRVIEDAAHAFGSYYQSKKVGSFGDISCFSFDGIKNITSGEGGCVVTDDEEVLQKLRDSRLLGVEKDTEKRFSGLRSWEFDVKSQGWRYHMSNLMASIGIEQLRRFDYLSKKRQEIAETYNKYFEGYPNVTTLPNDYSEIVPHIYVVILQKGINRKSVQDYLSSRGIQSGIHYYPNHKLTLFKETKEPLPVIESIYSRILTLPLHPDLTLNEVKTVCDELKICIDKSELDETIS
jgi:dTDP-4-amino-4,6-dideoxygalactose transaminase